LEGGGGILIHFDSIGDSPRNRIELIAIRIDSTQNESIAISAQKKMRRPARFWVAQNTRTAWFLRDFCAIFFAQACAKKIAQENQACATLALAQCGFSARVSARFRA